MSLNIDLVTLPDRIFRPLDIVSKFTMARLTGLKSTGNILFNCEYKIKNVSITENSNLRLKY